MGTILENIKTIRTKKGYSQEYMADKLGLSQAGYGKWENGRCDLSYNDLLRIADALEQNVIDIITYPDKWQKMNREQSEPMEAVLQIKLRSDKRDQVLSLVFGENNLEIFNK